MKTIVIARRYASPGEMMDHLGFLLAVGHNASGERPRFTTIGELGSYLGTGLRSSRGSAKIGPNPTNASGGNE